MPSFEEKIKSILKCDPFSINTKTLTSKVTTPALFIYSAEGYFDINNKR